MDIAQRYGRVKLSTQNFQVWLSAHVPPRTFPKGHIGQSHTSKGMQERILNFLLTGFWGAGQPAGLSQPVGGAGQSAGPFLFICMKATT